jgi:AcrR family transcriptional regulator
VARDARDTKDRLLRAGARLFATKGVDAALTRDIVRLAGQSNDSAVHYHFGSREGLLAAICAKHIDQMEIARRRHQNALQSTESLYDLVAAIVEPTAGQLSGEDGRNFLRIIAQLAGHAGIRSHAPHALLNGTALLDQLRLLESAVTELLPRPLALERLATVIGLLAGALGERARQLDEGTPLLLEDQAFTENLTLMIVGALRAPAPIITGRVPAGTVAIRVPDPGEPGEER